MLLPHYYSTSPTQPSSSSSSYSYSSFSSNPTTTTTMEEVWNDFNNISSLPNTPLPNNNYRGIILQDFLNSRNPTISPVENHTPPPPTAEAGVLNLNSGPEYHFFDVNSHRGRMMQSGAGGGDYSGFDNSNSSNYSVFNTFAECFGKRRFNESDDNGNHVDRRHKRMIKNRESAARSRARKQAYVQELENEISMLQEEVARLRKQHQIIEAPSSGQVPKKHGHHRASTAPF